MEGWREKTDGGHPSGSVDSGEWTSKIGTLDVGSRRGEDRIEVGKCELPVSNAVSHTIGSAVRVKADQRLKIVGLTVTEESQSSDVTGHKKENIGVALLRVLAPVRILYYIEKM